LMEHIALLMEGKPVKPLIDQQSYSWVDIVRLVHPTGLRPRLAPASCKLMLVLVKLWNTYCIVKAPCFFWVTVYSFFEMSKRHIFPSVVGCLVLRAERPPEEFRWGPLGPLWSHGHGGSPVVTMVVSILR
jgi:hypothetical protein